MIKLMLAATFCIVAIFSATAQVGTSAVEVTKKCPNCTPSVSELIVYQYERDRVTETLINPDTRGFIHLDWLKNTICFVGTDSSVKTYKIEKHNCSILPKSEQIWFSDFKLIIYFDVNNTYIGHKLDSTQP